MSDHVMILRHAEKPGGHGGPGLDAHGHADDAGLSLRGWQRAGALVTFFMPRGWRQLEPHILTPQALYAAANRPGSQRPAHTLRPLADALALPLHSGFRSGADESALVEALHREPGPVLISWRHEEIKGLVHHLTGDTPPSWRDTCFDEVWSFTRDTNGRWCREVVRQSLLAGDA